MAKALDNIYKNYNFPGVNKLRKILKQENIQVSDRELKDFINKQEINQVFNEPIKHKGRSVSFKYLDRIQIDILNMEQYASRNKGFAYILLIIDIFSRKLWAFLLKNRNLGSIETALTEFIDKYKPNIIISDNEASFTSKNIKELFDENNIKHITTEPTDHKALGVIDSVSKTIKVIIVKHMKYMKSTQYVDDLPNLIKAYNNTPHPALLDLSPNEATKPENFQLLFDYNLEKGKNNNKHQGQFSIGDKVRIRKRKTTFERAYDKKYSNIMTVKAVGKQRATLDDDSTVSLRRLKKVDEIDEVFGQPDVLDVVKKESKISKALGQAGVDQSNIIEGKRERKPNSKYFS